MNPATSTSSTGGKSGIPNSTSHPQQQQGHVQSPSFESGGGSRRSSSHSAATPRNNQASKKQHKNQRRPKLAADDAMESGTMRNSNSRRGQTSITHLMTFSRPPIPQYNSRPARRNYSSALGRARHAIDKARYVHANYRFVVKPKGNYRVQAIDADMHLDWDDVLQVLASAESQASACPICLSPPVAPRMAKCGHIFCLPCLIRYMHSTDDTNPIPEKKARWKKCPICWDSIYVSDTRPVRWYTGQERPPPREGEDVFLRLIMRQPGSTLALPRDGADILSNSDDVPWYFAAEVTDYARVMKGSEEYMNEQYDTEIEELRRQEKEDELMFGEETDWTRRAVGNIRDAKEKLIGIGNPQEQAKQPAEKKPKREPIIFSTPEDRVPEMYHIQHAAKSGQSLPTAYETSEVPKASTETSSSSARGKMPQTSTSETVESKRSNPKAPVHTRPHGADGHPLGGPMFFYQALPHYYLSLLDIRILKSAFGSYASFPSSLLPRVERVSTGHVVDDDLRRRAKYVAHLPYGCEVGFLECDWTDIVRSEVLEEFASEIDSRRKRNREKDNREEKDRIRAEREEEDKRWAAARRRRPSIPEDVAFSTISSNFQPIPGASSDPNALADHALTDMSSASPPWTSRRQGSGFGSLASPGTSPVARTVWGTTIVAPPSPDLGARHVETEGDGWLEGWEKQLHSENEEALIAQVQAASLGESSSAATTAPTPVPSGGKKKKAKKITLMSTTARRAA